MFLGRPHFRLRKRKRLTYREWLRLFFYTVIFVASYYIVGPILLGENVIIATLSLTATSLAIVALAFVVPELRSLPEQFDPTAEGQNWSEER